MLLSRIAPQCERYHGIDFSASAIRYVQALAAQRGLASVTLAQGTALDLGDLEPGSFDVVVLNSVIQYFPTAEYLLEVLERASQIVRTGGEIFVGDVRSLPLTEAFHTSVELERAQAFQSAGDLRRRIRMRLERENELLLDPDFFRALPQHLPLIRGAVIQLKRGRFPNELTRFRYDVLLKAGEGVLPADSPISEMGQTITVSEIQAKLANRGPAYSIAGIPNPRIARDVQATQLVARDDCPETCGEIRLRLSATPVTGIDPEDLFALDVPYDVELAWSDQALDRYDAIFRHRAAIRPSAHLPVEEVIPSKPWTEYSNHRPGQPIRSSLALELRDLAKERLPEYMIPASIVVLEALPRTPNGKVDRKALPEPDRGAPIAAKAYAAPQSELEKTIAAVLQELLHLERVGTHDNFFDLGANSLVMVQMNGRLRAALERELSLVDLFHYPTVSALAAHLNQNGADQSAFRQSQERGLARVDALRRRRSAPRSVPGAARVPPNG
jgi:acyl carrier protein